MDWADIEGTAEAAYRAAGLDQGDQHRPLELTRRLLGPDAVQIAPPHTRVSSAALVRIHDQWRIYVSSRLTPQQKVWALHHELAEYLLEQEGYRSEDVEQVADSLAACLIAPRPLARRVMREVGPAYAELASALRLDEPAAALRFGEATGTPLALVEPRRVWVRGEPFWPTREEQLRRLAKLPAYPGTVREMIGRRRVAMRRAS